MSLSDKSVVICNSCYILEVKVMIPWTHVTAAFSFLLSCEHSSTFFKYPVEVPVSLTCMLM